MAGMVPWRQHPFLTGSDWFYLPSSGRIFDQHFGQALNETDRLLREAAVLPYYLRPAATVADQNQTHSGVSEVMNDENQFAVNLDVSHFTPQELKVKMVDNMLTIEANHEEKMDPHGFIKRSFTRKYVVPKDVDTKALTSNLSKNGVLTIRAPKLAIEGKQNERTIPIQFGGASQPTQSIENKKEEKKEEKKAGK